MKTPTRTKAQSIKDRIDYIERTIRRLGACSISTGKLTPDEVDALKEHFMVEQTMGYTKFKSSGLKEY